MIDNDVLCRWCDEPANDEQGNVVDDYHADCRELRAEWLKVQGGADVQKSILGLCA